MRTRGWREIDALTRKGNHWNSVRWKCVCNLTSTPVSQTDRDE